MVRTNKDLCKSKIVVKNNPKTNTSLGPTFLGWQRASFRIVKLVTNLTLGFGYN
jgi:hypothetical protein